jgi:LysM repeat protein
MGAISRLTSVLAAFCAAALPMMLGAAPAIGAPEDEAASEKPAQSASPEPAADPPAAEAPADPPAAEAPAKPRKPRKPRPGGVDPCMTPDPGFGIYDAWQPVGIGHMLAPQQGGITKDGGFDVIVHFHGHHPIRKEFVTEAKGIVLIGVDLGVGSAPYTGSFSAPAAFENLLSGVEKAMAKKTGNAKAHVRKVGLSAWSAGYGAIEQILRQEAGKKVDAVILLDSVHVGYVDNRPPALREAGLEPFVAFAKKASAGKGMMFESYSSIIPPGYASTRETARFIIAALGGKPKSAKREDRYGLEMDERYDKGGYHARGYKGNDKPDHCAHIGLMKDVLRVYLNKRWKSPKGSKGKAAVAKEKTEAKKSGKVYVVQSGDSLTRIAARHGVTLAALRDANGLTEESPPIQPGKELILPAGAKKKSKDEKKDATTKDAAKKDAAKKDAAKKDAAKKDAAKKDPATKEGERVHVVSSGQSLARIAKRYQVTVDAIRERNGLTDPKKKIQPGDKLVIPKAKKAPAKKA